MIAYRAATRADAEDIARLHAKSWQRTYRGMYRDDFLDGVLGDRQRVWRERLAEPASTQYVCVAELDSRLAGFVCAYGGHDPAWGSFVDNLHVRHDLQRSGIGRSLIVRAATWCARSYPDAGLYLWVLEANDRARHFYEALGAGNAETLEQELADGAIGRTCRYVWPDVHELAAL